MYTIALDMYMKGGFMYVSQFKIHITLQHADCVVADAVDLHNLI